MNYEEFNKGCFEEAKRLYKTANADQRYVLEKLFPELKESEDERVKKTLIEYFNAYPKDYYGELKKSHILAWLEKQAENNKWKPSKDEMDALYGLAYITNKMDDKKDEAITKLYQDLKREFFNGVSYENMFPSSPVDAPIINGNQDEQNPPDNVELKFKVHDWVVFNNKHQSTYQVEKIEDGYYILRHTHGGTFRVCVLHDESLRLWDITKDAKDGDVLSFKNDICGIIICKSPTDYDTGSYCRLVNDNFINIEESGWDSTLLVPTTREQCVLLFEKMHEAGYEWDDMNKKLKKIEQASVDKVKPIFNVGDKIQHLKDCGTIMTIEKIENDEYIFANNMGHTTIENGNKWYLVEQNPIWGEEDEHRIKDIVYFLETAKKHYASTEELDACINWLKSLKYINKHSYTFDEIDKEILNAAILFAMNSTDEFACNGVNKEDVIDWLKSLRPQNHWKPSDEQMRILDLAIRGGINHGTREETTLVSLLNDLKKLKEE